MIEFEYYFFVQTVDQTLDTVAYHFLTNIKCGAYIFSVEISCNQPQFCSSLIKKTSWKSNQSI